MDDKKPTRGFPQVGCDDARDCHHYSPKTKESTILSILKSGNSLNTFEAARLGDTCLHSTISTLRSKGYLFHDEWEWVKTRFNREVHVKRYSYIGGKE